VTTELTEAEMDLIWDEAWIDAVNGVPGLRYLDDRLKRGFYEHAYRMNYAKENGDDTWPMN